MSALTATRTRDLLLRRHFRSVAGQRQTWPGVVTLMHSALAQKRGGEDRPCPDAGTQQSPGLSRQPSRPQHLRHDPNTVPNVARPAAPARSFRPGRPGCSLRPAEYGPWQLAYGLSRRWQLDGTWAAIVTALQALADTAGHVTWDVSVDSGTARAHQHAAGTRGDGAAQKEPPGPEPGHHALGRSRGGLTTMFHLAAEQGQNRGYLRHGPRQRRLRRRPGRPSAPLTAARRRPPGGGASRS
jgi:hypothetical protein